MFSIRILALLFLALPLAASAQESSTRSGFLDPIQGRHGLTLQVGLLSSFEAATDASAVNAGANAGGLLGALTYTYGLRPEWALTLSAGLLDASTDASVNARGVSTESASVTFLLFGATYYPDGLAVPPSLRPFASAQAGPFLGYATESSAAVESSIWTTGARSESSFRTALGLRLLGGADWFVARRLKLSAAAGYHFASDFDRPVGRDDNYSGPEFLFGLGFVFGRGQ